MQHLKLWHLLSEMGVSSPGAESPLLAVSHELATLDNI